MTARTVAPGLLALFSDRLENDAGFAELAAARLGFGDLNHPRRRVEAEGLADLVLLAHQRTGWRDVGLLLGHQLPLNATGSLGLFLVSASGLRELLTDLHRYWPMLMLVEARFDVAIDSEQVSFGFEVAGDISLRDLLCLEIALYGLLRLLRPMFGPDLQCSHVSYPQTAHGVPAAWQDLLGLRHQVGGSRLALNLPLRWLDATPLAPNPGLRQRLQPALDAELRRTRERLSWTDQVLDLLGQDEGLRQADLQACSGALGVSPHTLKLLLADEKTGFDDLLDALRRERAVQALLADQPVEPLAEQLGYRDRESFEREFRRWFQTSPDELREQASAAGFDARSAAAHAYDELPPAPKTCRVLIQLRYMEDAPMSAIVAAVEPDAALSAKLLGLANSAFYGARNVRGLADAIGRVLGLNEVIRLATLLGARQSLQPRDCPAFDLCASWSVALAVSQAVADLLREVQAPVDLDNARMLGLFHELGLQVLAHRAGARLQVHLGQLPAESLERDIRNAELRNLGTTRHIAGSILLARWGLPRDMVRALRSMDLAILDPHALVALEIRLIVLLSRYFRRRYQSLAVELDAAAILRALADQGLPSQRKPAELAAWLNEILEIRRMQAEEMLA